MKLDLPAITLKLGDGSTWRIVGVVDVEKLLRLLGRKAARNKGKRTVAYSEAIIVEAHLP